MFWSDISARVLSVVTMKRPNQSNLEHNERTVCWCNQSQLRYSIIRVPKNTLTSKVPCNCKSLENLHVLYTAATIVLIARLHYRFLDHVRVVLNCASYSRYPIKVAILYVLIKINHIRGQGKIPFHLPRLFVKSPTGRVTNITTQTLDRKTFVWE